MLLLFHLLFFPAALLPETNMARSHTASTMIYEPVWVGKN